MNKIYSNYDNHHVKATLVYANDMQLFYDPEFTKPVLHEKGELCELFRNGMIIVTEGPEYRPTMLMPGGQVRCCDNVIFVAADVEGDQ